MKSLFPSHWILVSILLIHAQFPVLGQESEDQSPETLYEQALAYANGDGVELDYDEAARLSKLAAKQGHAPSQTFFGYLHSKGTGARQSWGRASYWWELAADQDYAPAIFNLSTLYWFGIGVAENNTKAREYMERVVNPVNQITDSIEDFELLESIQNESYWRMGLIYKNGLDVESDEAKAAEFLEKAAGAGHYQAMLQTGLNYALGEGFDADLDKANLYLNMAMSQGSDASMQEARTFYLEGVQNEEKYGEELEEIRERYRERVAILQTTCGITLFTKSDREGVDRYDMAAHWLKLGVEGELPSAKAYLGVQYALGLGVNQSYEKAAPLLSDAAFEGLGIAEYNYAILLRDGLGVDQDAEQAALYFRRATRDCFYPAILAMDNPTLAELATPAMLVASAREAADNGSLTAKACFARSLFRGYGVEQDIDTGFEMLKACAESDDPVGRYAFGLSMREKQDEFWNEGKALKQFELAAERGHLWAKLEAGTMFHLGSGTLFTRYSAAVDYYKDCIEAGISTAKHNFALMYRDGLGVKENLREAERLFLEASEEGVKTANRMLGILYYEEDSGIPQNLDQAYHFFSRGADHDDLYSHFYLGEMFEKGKGIEEDIDKALDHYRSAGRKGHPEAAYRLGLRFKSADEVTLNYDLAAYWLSIASARGHYDALYHYAELQEFGQGMEADPKAAYETYKLLVQYNLSELAHLGRARCELFKKVDGRRKYQSIRSSLKRCLKFDEPTASAYMAVAYYLSSVQRDVRNPRHYISQSLEWFEKSIALESPIGMTELAKLHWLGRYEGSTKAKAVELFQQAADLGYAEAGYFLAKAHLEGIEGAPDEEQCVEYLHAAVEANVKGAEDLLKKIEIESDSMPSYPVYEGTPS